MTLLSPQISACSEVEAGCRLVVVWLHLEIRHLQPHHLPPPGRGGSWPSYSRTTFTLLYIYYHMY